MKTKLLFRLLILISTMVFSLSQAWAGASWNATNKTLTISGSFAKGTYNYTDNEAYSSFCASYSDVEHIVINGTLTSTTANDFTYFFAGLKKLKDITGLQYINWASATYITGMFSGCESLERIDFSNISTIGATNIGQMFYNCKSLKEIDFSHTSFPNVQHMDNFLNGCTSLISADFSGFVGNTVIGMGRFMYGCTSLRIVNMPDFRGINLMHFDYVFYNCTSLRFINIPYIRTSSSTDVTDCFFGMTGTAKVWVNYPASGATKIDNVVKQRTNFIRGRPNGDLKFKLPGGTVTLSQTSATYNGSAITTPTVTKVTMGMYDNDGSYDSGIEVPSGQYTVGYSNNTNAGQAVVTVTPKSTVVLDDYGATTANFTITPKDVTVSGITANGKVYDGSTTASLVTTGAAFSGKVGGDVLTVSAATGTFSDANAGTNKTVNISGLALGGSSANNYQLAASGHQATTTATITPAEGTLTFNTSAVNKTYGDGTFQHGGSVNGDGTVGYTSSATGVATVSVDGTVTIKGAGEAVITASVTGNNNYTYTNKQYTVNVGRKALTVTANSQQKDVGADDPALTYQQEGLVSGDSFTGALSREAGDAVGSYAVTQGTLSAGNNYDISFTPATLTIVRPLGITFDGDKRLWATYYAAEDLTLPDDMSAYTVTGISGNVVTLSEALPYIPANVGVLLSYESSGNDFKAKKWTGDTNSYTSELTGASTTQTMPSVGSNYVLYNGEFVLADGTQLAANRCYLHIGGASPAPRLTIGSNGTTGVDASLAGGLEKANSSWYTLNGQRLQGKPAQKGLYIVNGKKVVIK